jgi:hypothetical protein
MIGVVILFIALTVIIAIAYGLWDGTDKEGRSFILKALFKGGLFASIAFVILFVIVNVF